MGRCPPIDQALIDYLKGQFPLRLMRDQALRVPIMGGGNSFPNWKGAAN